MCHEAISFVPGEISTHSNLGENKQPASLRSARSKPSLLAAYRSAAKASAAGISNGSATEPPVCERRAAPGASLDSVRSNCGMWTGS
jgi:hypothetical protein